MPVTKYKNTVDALWRSLRDDPTDSEATVQAVTIVGSEVTLTIQTDSSSEANVTYVGVAAVGSITSDPVWQIVKYTITSGDVASTYADGNGNFDNIWDNRTGLVYS